MSRKRTGGPQRSKILPLVAERCFAGQRRGLKPVHRRVLRCDPAGRGTPARPRGGDATAHEGYDAKFKDARRAVALEVDEVDGSAGPVHLPEDMARETRETHE